MMKKINLKKIQKNKEKWKWKQIMKKNKINNNKISKLNKKMKK